MQTIDTLFKTNLISDALEAKLELLDNFDIIPSFNDIIQRTWKQPGLSFDIPNVASSVEANVKSILNSNPLIQHAKNTVNQFRDTSTKIQEAGLPFRFDTPSTSQIQSFNSISVSETQPGTLNNDPAVTSSNPSIQDTSNNINNSSTSVPANDIADPLTGPIKNDALPGQGVKPTKRIAVPATHSSKRQNTGPSNVYTGNVENYNLNLNNQNSNANSGFNFVRSFVDFFG